MVIKYEVVLFGLKCIVYNNGSTCIGIEVPGGYNNRDAIQKNLTASNLTVHSFNDPMYYYCENLQCSDGSYVWDISPCKCKKLLRETAKRVADIHKFSYILGSQQRV